MIAHSPTPLQHQVGWLPPEGDLPTASRSELVAARRLGLLLAVAVAAGIDLIVSIVQPTTSPLDTASGFVLGAFGIVPILAAAPFGWWLGPAAARTQRLGAAAIVVAMAIGVMILGDILTVAGIALGSMFASGATYPAGELAAGLVGMSLVGAMVVGPFVVAMLTLPASVAWIVAFRITWTVVRPGGRSSGDVMAT
jgi:hypothetical protein